MERLDYRFSYIKYNDADELPTEDKNLVDSTRKSTENAYAPYSRFHVAAGARLIDGTEIFGTNQENASYPVGICAERTLLSTLANLKPGIAIDTLVITYQNKNNGESHKPASPCGICRQSLLEYEQRLSHPIRILLCGFTGAVIELKNAADLLPFGFGKSDLI